MIHLILGGARSGKSSYAESLCFKLHQQQQSQITRKNSPVYIATAQAFDGEMQTRIEKHQQDRVTKNKLFSWHLIECPIELAKLLVNESSDSQNSSNIYLVDCLTLWLNNIIFELGEMATQQQIEDKTARLLTAITAFQHTKNQHLVLVANEVGLGVVPLGVVSRLFVDNAGWLNQQVAQVADSVTLITAGIPLALKGNIND